MGKFADLAKRTYDDIDARKRTKASAQKFKDHEATDFTYDSKERINKQLRNIRSKKYRGGNR